MTEKPTVIIACSCWNPTIQDYLNICGEKGCLLYGKSLFNGHTVDMVIEEKKDDDDD